METSSNSKKNPYLVLTIMLIVAGILMTSLALWGWWKYKYLDEETVFWKSIERSLTLNSVNHEIVQDLESQKVTQDIQLNFNDSVTSVTKLNIQEKQEEGGVTVETESIGTQTGKDYIRYSKLDVPDGPDYSSAVNTWASIESDRSTFLANSLSNNLVLFGKLNYQKRSELLNTMKNPEAPVYIPDVSTVVKSKRDGRLIYTYTVRIDSTAYAKLLIEYFYAIGESDFASRLATQPVNEGESFEVVMEIDAVARHIVTVRDVGAIDPTLSDTYSLQDVQRIIEEPKADKTYEELQELLRSIE